MRGLRVVDCDDSDDIVRINTSRDRRVLEGWRRLLGLRNVHVDFGARKARHCSGVFGEYR